ncbi:uncharacterized protein PEZ65_004231 [Lycodopsis pacificus]
MPLIGLFFFFLGLVVAPDMTIETTTGNWVSTASNDFSNYSTTVTPLNDTTNVTGTTSYTGMNTTKVNSTIVPSTTVQNGGGSSTSGKEATLPTTTPKPNDLPKTTTSVTTTNNKLKDKEIAAKPANSTAGDSTGIIILVVIVLIALGFGLACFFLRNRRRRNSVDFTSRPDETNIPLNSVEPIDAVPQNGLKTFESTETAKEPEEPEAKLVQEEQKAEAGKSVVEPSAESAAPVPVPTPGSSEDKPKEDVVEQSPPAPVEPSVEEKTDDESAISNKTSVESLKETNENNSNNAAFSQTRDTKTSFWDVPLDCPV